MTSLWRGFTSMAATRGREVVIVRGEGATVWDADGNAYLDGTASLWYCNVGYGRAEIADAVARQLRQLPCFHTFDVFANEPALQLAERVAGLAPMDDAAVFFTPGGGSDAIDTAAKLVRRYWSALGRPSKQALIAREHAYHGMNAFGTSLAGIPANAAGFGPLVHEVETVPAHSLEALAELLERSADVIAAFIGEPVIGAGGVIPPVEGYWKGVQELCRQYDVLLISDEVICGFGRLGRWFGCDRYGIVPDVMICAKGLTSGYVPLGAVVASTRVQEPFWADGAPPFRHGYTYGGHPAACAAALANLDVIEREGLVERVARLEPIFGRLVRDAFDDCPLVAEVRTVGLLAGIEIAPAALAAEPRLGELIAGHCREHGLIGRPLRGVALQLSPPFVSTEEELGEMARRLRAAFDTAAERDLPAGLLLTGQSSR